MKRTTEANRITLNINDLPVQLELSGADGKIVRYVIRAGGKKFGACLNKLDNVSTHLIK